jgi:hypothetical protein
MRTLAALVATTFVALMVASVASASPTISLVWTGTTGTGTTGSDTIDASVGDVLALDIRINVDSTGLSGAFVTLNYNGAELLALLGYGGSAQGPGGTGTEICPNPPNAAGPDICAVGTPSRTYSAITTSYYLTDTYNSLPNHLGQFNAVKTGAPFATNGVMTLGRAIFEVAGGTTSTINVANVLGLDSVNDSAGNVFNPTASATVVIPEPTTAALLGLGVFGLAIAGRRRA